MPQKPKPQVYVELEGEGDLGRIFTCPKNQNPRSIWNWKVREGFRRNICMPQKHFPSRL